MKGLHSETGRMCTGVNLDRSTAARDSAAPGELVEQAMRLVKHAEGLLEQAVISERMRDTSWERIGKALGGVTKSAAQKRFGSSATAYSRGIVNGDFDVYDDRDMDGIPEPINSTVDHFDVAYGELEDFWMIVSRIVRDQEELALLGNAKQGVRDRGEQSPWFSAVPLGELPPEVAEARDGTGVVGDSEDESAGPPSPRASSPSPVELAALQSLLCTALADRAVGGKWADHERALLIHNHLTPGVNWAEHLRAMYSDLRLAGLYDPYQRVLAPLDKSFAERHTSRASLLKLLEANVSNQDQPSDLEARFETIEGRLAAIEAALNGPPDA
ncbi:hypothetical protein [Streptomyces venezuelae]|uniref:hypothetical protein n=1 Tax=Streptomyces venezuelae TaxID=54571 RepID=UPI0036594C99